MVPAMEHPERLTIASRPSTMALFQAGQVRDRLAHWYPETDVTILPVSTEGDRWAGRLADLGGKGDLHQGRRAGPPGVQPR
ncbi:hypothetical protein [Streptomyces sp. NPDC051183]|uniref:hypothetical protein n=1 Tax=Streptomyces sp. NPDC051183 TaxID=3155165 RepID=UPI003422CBA5